MRFKIANAGIVVRISKTQLVRVRILTDEICEAGRPVDLDRNLEAAPALGFELVDSWSTHLKLLLFEIGATILVEKDLNM